MANLSSIKLFDYQAIGIKGQVYRKNTYGGERFYLDHKMLSEVGFKPGSYYRTQVNEESNVVVLYLNECGNKVSYKVRSNRNTKSKITIPVIDKIDTGIRNALKGCISLIITFVDDFLGSRVVISGKKITADIIKNRVSKDDNKELTNISFCAGAGIADQCFKEAGFTTIAACEYNPKVGKEDKYSEIFQQNHPEAVIFNVPMEHLKGTDLPKATIWSAWLDCTDFSSLSAGKTSFQTMHLFIHLVRLFYECPEENRPVLLVIENTPLFIKSVGEPLKLCFEELGFHVQMEIIDSVEYGSRTRRKRFVFVASVYEGFELPQPTGRVSTPLAADDVVTVDTLKWVTPETDKSLKHFIERQKKGMSHNHKITAFNPYRDSFTGTICRSHAKKVAQNLMVHPEIPDTYAFLDVEHLRYLHGIDEDYYLGDCSTTQKQAIGQGVCMKTFRAIAKQIHAFLMSNMFGIAGYEKVPRNINTFVSDLEKKAKKTKKAIQNFIQLPLPLFCE